MPTTPWTARVWAEFHAGNLSRICRDVLLTLRAYRGHGGLICPSHKTLAARVKCHAATAWRALQAGQRLGLVQWTERRIRIAWRSLRTSNSYRLTLPEAPVQPAKPPVWRRPATNTQAAGGEERKEKQEAREGRAAALRAMLEAARGLPDLLAARRAFFQAAR